MWMRRHGRPAAALITVSLAVIGILGITAVRADTGGLIPMTPVPEILTNSSPNLENLPADIRAGPTPVTIYVAELNQSELPGPRYMAFGPSSIGFSIDPRLLAILFAAVFVSLTVWFVVLRKKGHGNNDKEE
jgi:hypothetical protein